MSLPNNIGNIGTRLRSRDETRCVLGIGCRTGEGFGTGGLGDKDLSAHRQEDAPAARTPMNFDAGECQPVRWRCCCCAAGVAAGLLVLLLLWLLLLLLVA